MRPIARPEFVGSRRGRRVALFLAILLLTGLPLYLWPLREGIQGVPGAAALSGLPPDPRSATAVALLPADVWGGLLGHDGPRAPSSGGAKVPGNLTRIAPHEEGESDAGSGSGATPPMTTLLVDSDANSSGDSPGGSSSDSISAPGSTNDTSPTGGGAGGQGGSGESSPFPGSVGPFGGGGGGDGVASAAFVADPNPDDPPMPTPEPGTLLLVGFNLAMVGAVAWRRLNRGRERKPSG